MKKTDIIRFVASLLVLIVGVIAILVKNNMDKKDKAEEDETAKNRIDIIEDYKRTVKEQSYIIHALGGMNGEDNYINSIDCLKATYDAGYRLFEADVSFTSDGVLVLAHSGENNVWSRNDWEKRLGQNFPFEDGDDEDNKNETDQRNDDTDGKHLCSYEEFMSFTIQGKYKATSFKELVDFMAEHKDMYVMIDAGCRSYEDTKLYYEELVKEVGDKTEVLNRMIAGGQNTDMVRAAKEVYDFPLKNLYYNSDEKREEKLCKPEGFVKYCKDNGILSFSVAKEVYDKETAAALEDSELISYVFTVNEEDEDKELRESGADIIGTDYLWE